MSLLTLTKELCNKYKITPARSKGQNFLVNEKVYDDIIKAARLTPDDEVLEVGPGFGFLTAKLTKAAGRVVAVELDDRLAGFLRDALSVYGVGNLEVVNADILKLRVRSGESGKKKRGSAAGDENFTDGGSLYFSPGYKIVANLPYNISSIFLRKFLSEAELKPESMTLMLQKEVAERICARPPGMSILAVSVRFYAEPEIIRYVSKGNFWPAPEVDSAVIRFTAHKIESAFGKNIDEKKFFRLVKHGFSARRRMLKNNLAGGLRIDDETAEKALADIGLNPKIRAEGLLVDDWIKLFGALHEFMV